jgi:hypothetical protein
MGLMVLNVGWMNDNLNSKPSVSTRRCPGTLNVLARVAAQRIERGSPFCAPLPFVFGDGCGLSQLAHRDIRLVADALQRGVPSVSSAHHRAPRGSRTAGIVGSTIVRRPDRSDSTDHFDPRPGAPAP